MQADVPQWRQVKDTVGNDEGLDPETKDGFLGDWCKAFRLESCLDASVSRLFVKLAHRYIGEGMKGSKCVPGLGRREAPVELTRNSGKCFQISGAPIWTPNSRALVIGTPIKILIYRNSQVAQFHHELSPGRCANVN